MAEDATHETENTVLAPTAAIASAPTLAPAPPAPTPESLSTANNTENPHPPRPTNYTRNGDDGLSTLGFSNSRHQKRFRKDDPRYCALGDIDEMVSFIVLFEAEIQDEVRLPKLVLRHAIELDLQAIMKQSYALMGIIASDMKDWDYGDDCEDENSDTTFPVPEMDANAVHMLEESMVAMTAATKAMAQGPKIKGFVVGSGNTHANVIRTVARRAERSLATLLHEKRVEGLGAGIKLINRVSAYMFDVSLYIDACSAMNVRYFKELGNNDDSSAETRRYIKLRNKKPIFGKKPSTSMHTAKTPALPPTTVAYIGLCAVLVFTIMFILVAKLHAHELDDLSNRARIPQDHLDNRGEYAEAPWTNAPKEF